MNDKKPRFDILREGDKMTTACEVWSDEQKAWEQYAGPEGEPYQKSYPIMRRRKGVQ